MCDCVYCMCEPQVMHYLEGIPLTEAGSRIKDLSEIKRRLAKRRILTRCLPLRAHLYHVYYLFVCSVPMRIPS